MLYVFKCDKCKKTHTLSFGMNDSEGRKNAKCPDCGSKLTRIYNAISSIIKKSNVIAPTKMNKTGDIQWAFADHREKNLSGRSIGKRMSGARMDERTGRMVVDVISNTPDPLGKIAAMNKVTTSKRINQRVKRRK